MLPLPFRILCLFSSPTVFLNSTPAVFSDGLASPPSRCVTKGNFHFAVNEGLLASIKVETIPLQLRPKKWKLRGDWERVIIVSNWKWIPNIFLVGCRKEVLTNIPRCIRNKDEPACFFPENVACCDCKPEVCLVSQSKRRKWGES